MLLQFFYFAVEISICALFALVDLIELHELPLETGGDGRLLLIGVLHLPQILLELLILLLDERPLRRGLFFGRLRHLPDLPLTLLQSLVDVFGPLP